MEASHTAPAYTRAMAIPTEPIGSIPRSPQLIDAMASFHAGKISPETLNDAYAEALSDTIHRLEQTGSPVLSDGEQTKPSFATYPLTGLQNLAPDGVVIPFADGHHRQLPRLTAGPFRYGIHADTYLKAARTYTHRPVKQAVISASALSLLYPSTAIPGYPREAFLADLINEAEADIRGALDSGAANVQIDFTEGRLSLKLDPSANLLRSFIALNNQVLERFTPDAAQQDRRPCLPRRRSRLHPQRRHRLRRPPARPLPTQRRPLLPPDGQRTRPQSASSRSSAN